MKKILITLVILLIIGCGVTQPIGKDKCCDKKSQNEKCETKK